MLCFWHASNYFEILKSYFFHHSILSFLLLFLFLNWRNPFNHSIQFHPSIEFLAIDCDPEFLRTHGKRSSMTKKELNKTQDIDWFTKYEASSPKQAIHGWLYQKRKRFWGTWGTRLNADVTNCEREREINSVYCFIIP